MSTTGGLAAALRLVGAMGGVVDEGGKQVDLFEAEDAGTPLPAKGRSGPQGGRPPGARNRSTEEWVGYFLATHKSPLTIAGQIAGHDTGELHKLLQDMADARTRTRTRSDGSTEEVRVLVDPLAVLRLQLDAAKALMPYIHKQQPKAIEVDTKPRGVVIMADVFDAELGDDDLALTATYPSEQNQSVSDAQPEQSHAAKSHVDAK